MECSCPGIEVVRALVVTHQEKEQLQSGDKSRCARLVGFFLNGWVGKACGAVILDGGVPGLWVIWEVLVNIPHMVDSHAGSKTR